MSDYTIGVGCITFNRPKHLTHWLKQYESFKTPNMKLHIANDNHDRKGVAYRSNECLRELKECDYIFIFNDDCFPIAEGWAEFFIKLSNIADEKHFLYLKETGSIKALTWKVYRDCDTQIIEYNNCGGVMMFLTKEVLEKVGAFGKYGIYGFEHAGYSQRIHKAGLTPQGPYLCPEGAGKYIYAMDYDFHLPINKELKHHSSLMPSTIARHIQQNAAAFEEDIKTIYQPL